MNITLAISKIYDITTDECYGYITVPNYDYLLDSKCLYEFVVDHLSYFTKKSLSKKYCLQSIKNIYYLSYVYAL